MEREVACKARHAILEARKWLRNTENVNGARTGRLDCLLQADGYLQQVAEVPIIASKFLTGDQFNKVDVEVRSLMDQLSMILEEGQESDELTEESQAADETEVVVSSYLDNTFDPSLLAAAGWWLGQERSDEAYARDLQAEYEREMLSAMGALPSHKSNGNEDGDALMELRREQEREDERLARWLSLGEEEEEEEEQEELPLADVDQPLRTRSGTVLHRIDSSPRSTSAATSRISNRTAVQWRDVSHATKQQRLSQLLSQTEQYLNRLEAMIKQQQEVLRLSELPADKEPLPERPDVPTAKSATESYYSAAHQIITELTEPPRLLNSCTLLPHQLTGLRWLASLHENNLNGILADEMGLGKTVQTIALLAWLSEIKKVCGPHLVVAPLSTLSNWESDMSRFCPSIQFVTYKGSKEQREDLLQRFERSRIARATADGIQVLLTSYEIVLRDVERLKRTPWQYIIVDEAHRLKNRNSKLIQALLVLPFQHRLLLTGTPLQNNLNELWSLLHFVLPNIFSSWEDFDQWFSQPFNDRSTASLTTLSEEESLLVLNRLHQVLRPFLLRRRKEEVLSDLPQREERVVKCALSAMQHRLYQHLQAGRSWSVQDESGRPRVQQLNNLVMNHPYLLLPDQVGDDAHLISSCGKLVVLDSALNKLKKTNHRVLIFSQMTRLMNILEDFLLLRGHLYLRLDGSTKPDARRELIEQFNAESSPYFVFLLSTRAGGLGINLQSADTVILYDSDWNPQMDLQAQARAHRIGQTRDVLVLRLVTAGTVEETIADRAHKKLATDAMVIQAGLFNATSTEQQRQQFVESILKSPNLDRLHSAVPTDSELNRLLCRSPDEYELFCEMDLPTKSRKRKSQVSCELMSEEGLPDWLKDPSTIHIDSFLFSSEPAVEPGEQDSSPSHNRTRSGRRIRSDSLSGSAATQPSVDPNLESALHSTPLSSETSTKSKPSRGLGRKRASKGPSKSTGAEEEELECSMCGAVCTNFEDLQLHLLTICDGWTPDN